MPFLAEERSPLSPVNHLVGPIAATIDIESKSFIVDSKPRRVFPKLRFDVYEREFLAILGPSGCGKTTLLRMIAGLDTNYQGSIVVGGKPVRGPGRDRGLMFQESRLLPWLSIEKNVGFAIGKNVPKEKRSEIVASALRLVGLSDYARAWPSELSGGMAKRVALARAIVNIPYLLLLDEPLTALDGPTKYSLQNEIARIHIVEEETTTVLVTHDIDEAVYLADRVIVLSPAGSHALVEIPVPLSRPRVRTSEDYHVICAEVTKKVFELWWEATPASQMNSAYRR